MSPRHSARGALRAPSPPGFGLGWGGLPRLAAPHPVWIGPPAGGRGAPGARRRSILTMAENAAAAANARDTIARATLAEDDKDHARLGVWLEDLAVIKGGGVPGKF